MFFKSKGSFLITTYSIKTYQSIHSGDFSKFRNGGIDITLSGLLAVLPFRVAQSIFEKYDVFEVI